MMHNLEKILLTAAGIASFIAMWFMLRKRAAEASFIFLLTQFFSWILGLAVVQCACLDYPVREFAKANSTSFLFEYFILPTTAVYFILHYPSGKPLGVRILYYATVISAFTIVEVIIERFTLIIDYHSWTWYWTFISMSLLFYVVMVIYKWFFKIKKAFAL